MKKSNYLSCSLLIVALGFTIFSGCSSSSTTSTTTTSTMASADSARLVIKRSANMGTGLFLNVSVDGKRVGSASRGQTFNGYLSPGTHVVSVLVEPNNMNLSPTTKKITAQKGQTYTYTAVWDGNTLSLQ